MSIRPPARSAPGIPPLPSALPRFALACLLAAAIAALGCAPVHSTPRRSSANAERAGDRPDSAAVPAQPRETEVEPPTSGAVPSPAPSVTRALIVKASAYNSRRGQTDASPSIAAWGDRLRPGMRVIAVSRDLIELGLRRGQRVEIVGLEGEFVVLDRMPSRWRQKIDIYMGEDVRAARNWGVRDVEIRWQPAPEDVGTLEAFEAAGGRQRSGEQPD